MTWDGITSINGAVRKVFSQRDRQYEEKKILGK